MTDAETFGFYLLVFTSFYIGFQIGVLWEMLQQYRYFRRTRK